MKLFRTKLVLGLLITAVVVSFVSLQAISRVGDDPIRFNQDDSIRTLQAKIQQMRAEIARNGETFEVEMNPAMQYPIEQLCKLNPSMKPANDMIQERNPQEISTEMALPASYCSTYVTSIKDQGQCGSCWDFSTTGDVELCVKKATGTTYDFSEQYVLDCNPDGYNCNGGWFAYDMYMSPYYSHLESCYPYKAVQGTCKTTCANIDYITNAYYVTNGSSVPTTTNIKNAIYTYGGVAAAVYAESYFQAYSSGCFSHNASGSVDHAIMLVGWNDTTPCSTGAWLLKNSWGTSWGVNPNCGAATTRGYMWIKYGVQQVGYAAAYAVY